MGEFGRTPRIGRVVMNAATNATGRDHWPHAYCALLAGGGVRGGQAYGTSDRLASQVTEAGVSPPTCSQRSCMRWVSTSSSGSATCKDGRTS